MNNRRYAIISLIKRSTDAVILPENLIGIGRRAFAGCDVKVVVFQGVDTRLSDDAFDGFEFERMRFACVPGSPAADWASDHGIPVTSCLDAA